MSKVSYVKGVRTRYRNTLAREIDKAQKIQQEVFNYQDQDELLEIGHVCLKLLNTHKSKLEDVSKELASVIEDSDSEFVHKILDEDCELLLCVEESVCKLERCLDNVAKNSDIKPKNSDSEMQHVIQIQGQVQDFMIKQMKEQREFFHRYENKDKKEIVSVKLPTLDLCVFNGNKLKWTEFWDAFECSVHENKRLSNIEKFSYLLSKLRDEAKLAVAGIPLANESYEVAIQLLKERFGNKQEIVDLHYKALLNVPPCSNKAQSLRPFVNEVEKHLRSLEVLQQSVDQQIFVSIIRSKLPEEVLKQLELQKGSQEEWSIHKLREYLMEYINACEKAKCNSRSSDGKKKDPSKGDAAPKHEKPSPYGGAAAPIPLSSAESLLASTADSSKGQKQYSKVCRYCGKAHWSDECLTYKTIEERKNKIKGSCYRCLKDGHMSKECKANRSCVHCGEYNVHHRSLCPKKFAKKKSSNEQFEAKEKTGYTAKKENAFVSSGEMVLMQTAKAEVKSHDKTRSIEVRALLDCGSQRTYISKNLAEKLRLKKDSEEEIKVATFGSRDTKTIHIASTQLWIKLKNGDDMCLNASVVPVISGHIHRKQLDIKSVQNLDHLLCSVDLADSVPTTNESTSVDLLIGNDFYLDIILSQKIEVQPGLYLLSSKLGWILTGRSEDSGREIKDEPSMLIMTYGKNCPPTHVFQSVDGPIETKPELDDFWKVESIGVLDRYDTTDDEMAMDNFRKTVRFKEGRYEVTWPWKSEDIELPMNKELAYGRLKSCVRKLTTKPELLKKYDDIIQDQLEKGVIERVDNSMTSGKIHYLPHHAVITPQKTTTKVRVVYDASAKTRPEYNSLNECLNRGPVMLHDLCGLLMRFRLRRIAMIADIEKAFLQIGLRDDQRNVTRFLWLKSCENPSTNMDNIEQYRFCRVPFGVISSPFLLGATVENHLDSYSSRVAEKIKADIYVDNVITGVDSVGEGIELYKDAKTLFHEASMNLREWFSNDERVMEAIPEGDRSTTSVSTVLGHTWDLTSDTLSIKKFHLEEPDVLSKRSALKTIASVFDPMGLFNPILLRGKLLLQNMWIRKLDWDDPITDAESIREWCELCDELKLLCDFNIPRCISQDVNDPIYELACFCDASAASYAASVYLRQSVGRAVSVNLVFAKSRLAPVKTMTIPRLELMAVLIGTRCLQFVKRQLSVPIEKTYLWTDSRCVLGWLQSSKTLPVFVKNRVSEINSHTEMRIGYVKTNENPADIATRGMTAKDLIESDNWWHGPKWLTGPPETWPSEVHQDTKVEQEITDVLSACDTDVKSEKVLCSPPFDIDYLRFSSFTRLVRVTAWVLRFVRKVTKKSVKSESLINSELEEAERMWIRFVQKKDFGDELNSLRTNGRMNLIQQLRLFTDEFGILRCKGRLEHSDLSQGARFPILLHGKDKLTQMIVERVHKQNLHSGVSQTLARVRSKYWIPKGRAVIRSILKACSVCRRCEGGPYKMPPIAPLPPSRVREDTPFSRTGLDYFGPIYVKTADGPKKTWVCLFTCMVIRAVHLELLQDMTTEEFLMGFRRFVAQRGAPVEIESDNAKQFKAASEVVKQIWKIERSEDVQSYVSDSGINWRFIIELAPWMGGFYERLVGVVKRSLRKTMGRRMYTIVQLQTVLKEAESIINSRPLVYVDNDINSNIPLSPNHFLTLNPNIGIPESVDDSNDPVFNPYESTSDRLLKTWKKGQKLLTAFWRIWREEYLNSIRERCQNELKTQRIQAKNEPKKGDVVLVKDSTPRGTWKLGRLTELVRSNDGHFRSAKVKLSSGTVINRSFKLLYPLECTRKEAGADQHPMNSDLQLQEVSRCRLPREAKEKALQKMKTFL